MRMLLVVIVVTVVFVTTWIQTAPAGQPVNTQDQEEPQTIEMWYYRQALERYDDPKNAVRRNAEFAGQQRRYRIAAMKWYGFSNSRPVASPTPILSMYGPAWQSNSLRPYAWYSTGRPTVVISRNDRLFW
ncbi:MAG: hypothetical protein JW829_12915 [Pirellulales bacterium]|nr:hypothetical protein [Pirellulales bacterium]